MNQSDWHLGRWGGWLCAKMKFFSLWIALSLFGLVACFDPEDSFAKSFQRQITPVLTKAGCNQGSCHGAAAGRGGFHLSLYGSDPAADYREIVQKLGGRRIHRVEPQLSLLLRKATESMEHGGGQRLLAGGAGSLRIEKWIRDGAYWEESSEQGQMETTQHGSSNHDLPKIEIGSADLMQFLVTPSRSTVATIGESIPLTAKAVFSDGTTEDVTAWTVFEAEDESSLEIDANKSEIKVLRPGRHLVIARYLTEVIPIEFLVPVANETAGADGVPTGDSNESVIKGNGDSLRSETISFIDQRINERLSRLKIPASPGCSDATFLRRSSLDLTGRLPTLQQVGDYLSKPDLNRRSQWVDTLLASEEFTEYWTLKLAQLFRLRQLPNSDAAIQGYHRWIGEQLRARVGYDQIVRSLLTSRGDTAEIGPANFLRTAEGPRQRAELVSEVFMASRLRCANCHDHPLDRWTQDDYHGLAAIFATIEVGTRVEDQLLGKVTHPKTGQDARLKLPGGPWLKVPSPSISDDSPSDAYANWLLDVENPYFAKAIVNRLWRAMMGRGLVEPVDDFRQTNPASHPELLGELAEQFVLSRYDLRQTLRLITLSDAYQRSSQTLALNQSDDTFYSRYYERPLPAEVIADAISDVLDVSAVYGDEPKGTRAIQLVDPQIESRALDVLGRCSRESSCEDNGDQSGQGLSAKLFVFNGAFINQRLESDENRLGRLLASGAEPIEVIQSFYRSALQRSLTKAEMDYWSIEMEKNNRMDHQSFLRDFVWSLLACREFTTNH